MTWIETTLNEFGKDINIKNLQFNHDGIICLEFGEDKTFYIENVDDYFLLYLAIKISINKTISFSHLISLTHYKFNRTWQINVGFKDNDTVVFIVKIKPEEFTTSNLEAILEMFNNLNNEIFT